jgi:long-chain acyl-CoA synthetase
MNETNPASLQTLDQLLERSVRLFGGRPALGMAFEKPLSYSEFYNGVVSAARLLTEQGIARGDHVALLGENSPQWGMAYFGILRVGAIAVPILPDFPEADVRHILQDAEVKLVFTTSRQLEKVIGLEGHRLQAVITLDDFQPEASAVTVEPLSRLLEKARAWLRRLPERFGLVSGVSGPEDTASIIYTSGTSGHSKAVMLTHRNFLSDVLSTSHVVEIHPGWTFLSILPLSHTYEFTLGFLFPLLTGARIVYVGRTPSPTLLEKICRHERPQVMAAVPLLIEKIYKKKVKTALEKNLMIRMLRRLPGVKTAIYRKIGRKLVDFFGGDLRLMAIGGAPLNREAEEFLRTAGFPYLIGYGLTETAPLLAGGPWREHNLIEVGSTGKPIAGVEIRIHRLDPGRDVGEVLVRGGNIMKGYYKNPKLTRETIDEEGWLRTGDLGRFDRKGNLHIMGRCKNMILMANGENIYPEAIEEKLNANLYISESLLVENNGLLEAWVYLDYELIDDETHNWSEERRAAHISQLLESIRNDVNPQLPAFAQIRRLIEQNEPFVKTATHKIKRYLYSH